MTAVSGGGIARGGVSRWTAAPGYPPTILSIAPRFAHLRALDGLRGLAVALVVAYHLAPAQVPGGFLGVDVFFVLSGFLITSLLLDEVAATGRVRLGSFYLRRLRRLAPALLLLLAALCAYAAVWATPGELTRLREHALWTLGYLANWKFILDGTTYTDIVAGQSPLRHAWSLAIEEQFYVVFPFVVLLLGRLLRWRPGPLRRALVAGAMGGAMVSAVWMAALWGEGEDPSRGYFGTDTRAHSLLVGVALGALLVGRPPVAGRALRAARVAAPLGAGLLVVAVAVAHEGAAWLQHGGFLVVALAVAAVISGLEGTGWLRRPLSARPLVALGVVSYGVYLWHWPVIMLVDDARTGLDGPVLAAVRLGLTLVLATTSYWLVERPIRHGAIGRRLARWSHRRVGRAAAPALVTSAVALLTVLILGTTAPPPAVTVTLPVALAGRAVRASAAAPAPGTPAAPALDVVLFGDSVAHTLAGGAVGAFPHFDPWAPEMSPFDSSKVRLWSVAKPACSFLPGLLVVEGAAPADLSSFCGDWRRDLDESLAARPGAVVLVALANDASDRRVDGTTVRLGAPQHAVLVAALLDEVRRAALQHGGRVALIALPPRSGSFATAIDAGGERERRMRDELEGYAEQHRGVVVLDLFDQICPQGGCDAPARGFDPSWRYDGMHYTPDGARWVAAWLTSQLTP